MIESNHNGLVLDTQDSPIFWSNDIESINEKLNNTLINKDWNIKF